MVIKKNGQIGITLTWMVAFILIVGILIIFLVFAGILAGQKTVLAKIPFFGQGKNQMNILATSDNLRTQRVLLYALETSSGTELTVKELILKWKILENSEARGEVASRIENIFEQIGQGDCYLFRVDDEIIYSNLDSTADYIDLSRAIVFLNNQKIKLELYSKKCN
jgi:hypothetical protein